MNYGYRGTAPAAAGSGQPGFWDQRFEVSPTANVNNAYLIDCGDPQ